MDFGIHYFSDVSSVYEKRNDLELPLDYFQLIIVDECQRFIHGRWKKVLDHFFDTTVLGLTATPTPEAYAYFNKNIIEESRQSLDGTCNSSMGT